MSGLTWEPISLVHSDAIFKAVTGNVAKYFYDFKNIDDTRAWVSQAVSEHANGRKQEYVIFDGDEFIGMISPCYITPQTVEIGIWITPNKQGVGYGSQALSTLLERLRAEGVQEVIYETDAENEASIRLAKTLGFAIPDKTKGVRFIKTLKIH